MKKKKNPEVSTFYNYIMFSHKDLFLLSFTFHLTDFFFQIMYFTVTDFVI